MKQIKNLLLFLIAMSFILNFQIGCKNRHKIKTQPRDIIASPIKTKPTVNVFIENSGSMDGYVKGVTEFEQAVYNYLSDIKISGITDTLNLFYVNSEIILQGSDIEDFIKKLEPSTFKIKGGKRGSSDIAEVLKSVLKETAENNISILITDGIFSPGGGQNAQEYLVNQEIGIKNTMAQYLQKLPNTAVIVYQLFSRFNGTYFNNVDAKIPVNEQRPYYIWIFGQTNNLATLRNEVPESKFNGSGIANMFSIVSGNQLIDFAVKTNSGSFDKSRKNPKTEIEDLSKDSRTGKVRFAVNADFTNLLLGDDYLLNNKNYELENYELEVKRNDSKTKYTHSLNFTSDKVRNGEISVKLKTAIPKWVEDVNDSIGSMALPKKTYGIKHQISGIYKAFTIKNEYYTEIKINIK